jgi:hypothetical protein
MVGVMEKERFDFEKLKPVFKKGTYFWKTAAGEQVRAVQVTNVEATGFGTYQFTRHWGGLIDGIRFRCMCGCGELQEMKFSRKKGDLHGEWNGQFDNVQIRGNRISIIDGFWAMTYE